MLSELKQPRAAPGMVIWHGDIVSGIKLARSRAFFAGVGSTKSAEHAVQRGIADAEPVLLADEMMAQMILLDEAAQLRARHIGNMRDVMHPFIMQDRQHHAEQRQWRGSASKSKREQPDGEAKVRHQKPDRQEQQIEPAGLDMVVVMQAVLQLEQRRPGQRGRVKGKAVHAIFAEIKQQRAEQYRYGLQRDGAEQPGSGYRRHSQQQYRDAAMTNENEKHFGRFLESGAFASRTRSIMLAWPPRCSAFAE